MEPRAVPEFVIGPMRLLTMSEMTFFYVTNQPTPFADLDKDLDPLLDSLYEAKALAGISGVTPDIVRHYKADTPAGEPDLHLMEVGIPVKPGTLPAGKALVKTLPPCRYAALLLWGSLAHIVQAYETLSKAIQEAGLEQAGEWQEWNFWFESGESPLNLMALYAKLR